MNTDIILQNKAAWEHLVYEWRVQHQGTPQMVAKEIMNAPNRFLRYHAEYFNDLQGKRIASICGSDGRRAVALAVLEAEVTVFDISEPQKRYALELAEAAGVKIEYEIGDFCKLDVQKYDKYFNYAYCEGGILHYFHDLDVFFAILRQIIKFDGILILCDYHPFRKTMSVTKPTKNVELTEGNYFDCQIHKGHVPYMKYFASNEHELFPSCFLRFYTLSEIINTAIKAGFTIKGFYEHPKHNNPKLPGEFTIIAHKI